MCKYEYCDRAPSDDERSLLEALCDGIFVSGNSAAVGAKRIEAVRKEGHQQARGRSQESMREGIKICYVGRQLSARYAGDTEKRSQKNTH